MTSLRDILLWMPAAVVFFAAVEALVLRFAARQDYDWRASLASLADFMTRQYVVSVFVTVSIATPLTVLAMLNDGVQDLMTAGAVRADQLQGMDRIDGVSGFAARRCGRCFHLLGRLRILRAFSRNIVFALGTDDPMVGLLPAGAGQVLQQRRLVIS